MRLDGWVGAAGDLLLGAQCPGCDRPGWGLCPDCRGASPAGYLTRPDPCPDGFPLTATAGPYDRVMKKLVSAHKERQTLTLTPFLAARLSVAVSCLLGAARSGGVTSVVLVPVPSATAVVRRRGFDASWAICRRAARELGRVERARVSGRRLLVQGRRVQDQAGLGATARWSNLVGSFRVAGTTRPGEVVVIVDDVVTTGSSLTEAARALQAAGVPVLGAATVAATVRSRGSR